MPSALKWRCLLATSVALSLLAAGTAAAGVPKFKPKTIVTGKSIGGVKVGMTKAKAIKKWGKPDRHQTEGSAVWFQYVAPSTLDNGFVTPPQPYAGFYVRNHKVIEVNLETAENTSVDPKLNKLKTSKGIKLHSTMDQARDAYGFPEPQGGEAGLSRGMYKQGKRCTLFYAPESPYQDIQSITVGLCSANVGMLVGAG
jgi:hypothetical protein